MHSDTKLSEIKEVHIFPVLTDISIVRKNSTMEKNEFLSQKSADEISRHIKTFFPESIKLVYNNYDTNQVNDIGKTANALINTIEKKGSIKKVTAPKLFTEILEAANQDYGMFFLQIGFTRTRENSGKEYLKSQAGYVLSLGWVNIKPNNNYSTMISFIVDRKNKSISMFRKSMWNERDPTDPIVIRSQLRDVILRYFQTIDN